MGFFDDQEISYWKKEWKEMPEFNQDELRPFKSLTVHFESYEDILEFANLIDRKITNKTKSIWFHTSEENKPKYRFISRDKNRNIPKYPIYIISKSRWQNPLTANSLEKMNIPYYIVIEPQEYKHYKKTIDKNKILKLPFSNLGQGSIPARNWVWNHAKESGHKRHWILDDNIAGFIRMYKNKKIPAVTGAIFRAAEDFVDRYKNVPMAGFNYRFFAENRSGRMPAFYLNTRVYSCILLQNNVNYEWRGRYNEDTDLSLQILKDGWCTILFQAFLCNKKATMTMSGGNTDELYKDDGRLKMAKALTEQHPDVSRVSWKWGRWQHHVDYSKFKMNKLKISNAYKNINNRIDDYGFVLQKFIDNQWIDVDLDDNEFKISPKNKEIKTDDSNNRQKETPKGSRKRKKRTRNKGSD
jgi:hypothetical protein